MGKSIKFKDDKDYVYVYPFFPVGSIYISVNNVNPTNYFGGTWERITDRFLIGAGSSYSGGATGGSTTVTLEQKHIPWHTHTYSGTTSSNGSHSHTSGSREMTKGGTSTYTGVRPAGYTSDKTLTAVDSNGAHTHTYSGTTSGTGSGNAHDNMPPYLAVYIWKKTAL
jgi:hypothetical protein